MAPEGTQLIFRLQPGKEHWESVLKAVGHLTAVSDRALTLQELAPYSAGELAVFVDADGRRSTAIRATADHIPHALLDAYGISVQTSGNGLALLTDRVRPTEQVRLPRTGPWFGIGRIGTLYLRGTDTWGAGVISSNKDGWSLRLPRQALPKNQFPHLPEGTVAFLATPVLTNGIEISGVTERMESIVAPFNLPSLELFSRELLRQEGAIVIKERKNGFSFLLGSKGMDVEEDGWRKLLLAAAAFRHPKTQSWSLPDTTKAQEIRVDPASVTLEERTVLGAKVMQAKPTAEENLLLAIQPDGRYGFSDDESLLMDWLGKKSAATGTEGACERGKPSAYVNLERLYRLSASDLTFHTPSVVRDLSQTFHAVSLKKSWFSSVFLMCF